MSKVDEVTQILRSKFDWSVLEAPHPDTVASDPRSADEIAHALDGYLFSQGMAMVPPYGAQESNVTILRRRLFTENCKYWALSTSLALGHQVEIKVPSEGPAQSPTDWWDRQERLVNRIGEALCSADEFARRNAYASVVPIEWRSPDMDPVIYQLAVREGYLPVGMERFDPAYLQSNPRLKDVRGLSAIMWMENLRASDLGKPWPWLNGKANPAVKP